LRSPNCSSCRQSSIFFTCTSCTPLMNTPLSFSRIDCHQSQRSKSQSPRYQTCKYMHNGAPPRPEIGIVSLRQHQTISAVTLLQVSYYYGFDMAEITCIKW
jgi:hypothetical protein